MVKSLKISSLLMKGAGETINNQAKEQESEFLGMRFCTLIANLSGNLLKV